MNDIMTEESFMEQLSTMRNLFNIILSDENSIEWVQDTMRRREINASYEEIEDKLRVLCSLESRKSVGLVCADFRQDENREYYECIYFTDHNGNEFAVDELDPVDLVNAEISVYGIFCIGFYALVADVLTLYWHKL